MSRVLIKARSQCHLGEGRLLDLCAGLQRSKSCQHPEHCSIVLQGSDTGQGLLQPLVRCLATSHPITQHQMTCLSRLNPRCSLIWCMPHQSTDSPELFWNWVNRHSAPTSCAGLTRMLCAFCPEIIGTFGSHLAASPLQGPIAMTTLSAGMTVPSTFTPTHPCSISGVHCPDSLCSQNTATGH